MGLRAQSLYSYFPSKDAILDAMFAQGASDGAGALDALADGYGALLTDTAASVAA